MRFLHPEYLWLLLLLPAYWALEWMWLAWRRRQAGRFAEPRFGVLLPSGSRWGIGARLLLWSLGVVFLAAGLARPQGAPSFREGEQHRFLNVYLVVDCSLSMLARDLTPDRLTAVKREIRRLLARRPGDRVGLVAFAGEARVVCPATFDHEALSNTLERLQTRQLRPGSDPGAGLRLALEKLTTVPGRGGAVVLFTDGEAGGRDGWSEQAREALRRGVHVYAVGAGTLEGEAIPIGRDFWGREQYRVHQGRRVRTRLVSPELHKAVLLGGGRYWPLAEPGGVSAALAGELERQARLALRREAVWVYREWFPWAAGSAWLLFWLEPVWPAFRRRRT